MANVKSSSTTYPKVLNHIPTIGIVLFLLLFVLSTLLYPGGSQADPASVGFDWLHNYWCNLMNKVAINGQPNFARPLSITEMLILCSSLAVFFFRFAETFSTSLLVKRTIQIGGIVSMVLASAIFTEYHDLMTILSSGIGLFVVVGILITLFKTDLKTFKTASVFCIVLLCLNNYIYYTQHLIVILPLLQKITFAAVLLWAIGLNNELIKSNQG